jgi:stage III sporulation protein SpoIIIAA
MMVVDRSLQHDVMIEAVQNHAPECIIIDEIGTKKEATATTDITQHGVQIIGTAHGTERKQVIENPELNIWVGGVHAVILGDEEANHRKLKTKSVLERIGPCAFDCAIELRSRHSWVIYQDLAEAVDHVLLKNPLALEVRRYDPCLKQLTIEKIERYLE